MNPQQPPSMLHKNLAHSPCYYVAENGMIVLKKGFTVKYPTAMELFIQSNKPTSHIDHWKRRFLGVLL